MKLPPGYVPGSGVHKASGFGGFGERLLRKQGWQKGEGLGKDKSGRAEAIEVKKKEDNVGIGGNKVHFNTDKWWEGAFDTALDVVNHKELDTDSESDVSTVDAVMVAHQNNDGTITSAQQHELAIAAEMAKQPAWFGGGRFSGREGKMARIRQQEALAAAKLGLALPKVGLQSAATSTSATATAAPLSKPSKKRKAGVISIEGPESSPSEATTVIQVAVQIDKKKGKKKKGKKDKQEQASAEHTVHVEQSGAADAAQPMKKRVVIEPAYTAVAPAIPFVPTPASGWWGAKKFTSAGCLEGIEQEKAKAASERQQFDEDDQTNLYMAAHNLKTQNKKGLGSKSHTGKVAGAKWEGSKTVFADAVSSDDCEGETSALPAVKAQQAVQHSGGQSERPKLGSEQLPSIKWKKLAAAELKKADKHQMQTKKLQKALMEQAMAKHSLPQTLKPRLLQEALEKLTGSSQFSTSGKYTVLSGHVE